MRACDYHMQHAAQSDIEGKFVAFTNLGLNLTTRCEWADAAKFHKVSTITTPSVPFCAK